MYLLLAALFFSLGMLSFVSPRKSIILFAFCLVIFPTSLAFGEELIRNGLYFFDFYFFPLAINLIISKRKLLDLPENIPAWLLVGMAFFLASSVMINTVINLSQIDSTFLSDIRILLIIAETLIFCSAVRQINSLSYGLLTYLALCAALSCLLLWAMNYENMLQFKDVYYEEFNRTRYKQVGTEVCLLYIIFYFFSFKTFHIERGRVALITLALCALAVLASGSRIVVVAVGLASVLAGSNLLSKAGAISLGAIAVIGFLYAQFYFGFLHVTDNLSVTGIWGQLTERFSPAMPYLANTNFFTFLFGHGFGTSFYIPWFEYRDLNTEQSVLDSAHLTMFIKFGIMYLGIIAILFKSMIAGLPRRLGISIVIYFMFIGFVVCFPYRPGFIGSVMWCSLFANMLRTVKLPTARYARPSRSRSRGGTKSRAAGAWG